MKKVRVRYAPSPTGHLHIGGARTALFNYLFAKHNNGDFIVRIEDTDTKRNLEHGEASQLDNLEWLGITPDESPRHGGNYGPYRQTERLDLYNKHVQELLDNGNAYECFCTPEELEADRERQEKAGIPSPRYNGKCRNLTQEQRAELKAQGVVPSIRVTVPLEQDFTWNDMVRGEITVSGKDVGDWVIVKSDGIPTYNFAVVIDDHYMEITHVFRGEEHTSNTPKQIHLYEMFGWEVPQFAHMTLIINHEGKKLSKRDESIMQFISQYKDSGYLPEAMFNYFALLGWSPTKQEFKETEIFTKEQLVEIFDAAGLSKSPSMFDTGKLKWVNNRYLKQISLEDAIALIKPFLAKAYDLSVKSEAWTNKLIELYKNEISFGEEIIEASKQFFADELPELDAEAKEFMAQEGIDATVAEFKNQVANAAAWDNDAITLAIENTKNITGAKGKNLFMPIRIATSGQMHGPDLKVTLELIGKENILRRIK